jgi:hypothetical protein
MFIEKKKQGKKIKYYLSHSYREEDKINKIRKYLGSNLSKEKLEIAKQEAETKILELLKEINTQIFTFTLTKNQVKSINKYNNKISVFHLSEKEWKNFTEEFVYNTNAIEGSTVQLEEVKEILEKEKTPSDYDEFESRDVAKAVEYIRKTKEDFRKIS